MAILADYHMHSHFSGDSQANIDEMIQVAVKKGLTHMCITDHLDYDYQITDETPEGMFELDVPACAKEIKEYQEKCKGQIKLLHGIEIGMQEHLVAKNTAIAESQDFDFVLASSHLMKGYDPCFLPEYARTSDEEMYRAYFEEELRNMKLFQNFDVYGHIDYVIRYGDTKDANYSYKKYQEIFEEMIEVILQKGKGFELNTAGIRKGLKQMHPSKEFLTRYRQRGGEIITVGSDAHVPGDIGAGFDLAAEYLKECGFEYYCTFEKRKPTFHKL